MDLNSPPLLATHVDIYIVLLTFFQFAFLKPLGNLFLTLTCAYVLQENEGCKVKNLKIRRKTSYICKARDYREVSCVKQLNVALEY